MEEVVANLGGRTRREEWRGRSYLVAPMTLLVPGVLNGSKGPLFYPLEEVSRDPAAWNGMPIVVNHPVIDGQHVSARDPQVLADYGVGHVYRTRVDGKLVAEAWFDELDTKRIDMRVWDALAQGRPIEVSTGLFTTNHPADSGAAHNGVRYGAIARDLKPDHLAVLPDTVGACSIKDGCGVLANAAELSPREKRKLQKRLNRLLHLTDNSFCATGLGGGVDPHCGTTGGAAGGLKAAIDKVKSWGASIGHAEHVAKAYVTDKIAAGVAKLPPKAQKVVNATFAVVRGGTKAAFVSWTAGQAFAERVAKERGHTPEQARRLRGVLATMDVVGFKPLSIALGASGLGAGAIGAVSMIPPASAGYLAYSTARNPMATLRAARGVVQDAISTVRGRLAPAANELILNGGYENTATIAKALEAHGFDDWYIALLSVAIDESETVGEAIKVADAAFKAQGEAGKEEDVTDNAAEFSADEKRTLWQRFGDFMGITGNSFCSTGPGGGIDPHCSPKGSKGAKVGSTSPVKAVIQGQSNQAISRGADAKKASAAAKSAGTKDAHSTAAAAHALAMASHTHAAQGYKRLKETDKAKLHASRANEHQKAYRKHSKIALTANTTTNELVANAATDSPTTPEDSAMKLTPEQRTGIVTTLTANCACWKDGAETLNKLPDAQLVALEKANEKQAPPNIPTVAKVEQMIANAAKEATTNAVPVAKPIAEADWFAAAPASVQSAVRNAMQIEQREKAAIIGRLTANVAADRKDAAAQKLQSKTLDDLRDMADFLPAPVQNTDYRPTPLFFGADVSPVGNAALKADEDDTLPVFAINWGDEKQTA